MWYVFRSRLKYGPYTEEELKAHVASGYFARTDMAWQQGMSGMAPIHRVIALPRQMEEVALSALVVVVVGVPVIAGLTWLCLYA
jgi:hypothetical protein